ncbi:unnamed protein product [Rangifer tarandus platyrhynchus]|uniref:Uncharacterized protein n=1 Tax=Rangifer tarandus platyrhynchus TaxID=3082113 RepID=A0ABN8ZMU2_RANTA|nr:unnamed protein product [Rangifer tarandus platyrhynchus]
MRLMGAAFGGHPAALEPPPPNPPRDAPPPESPEVRPGPPRRRPPFPPPPPPAPRHPVPGGEEQLMGTCDFFHQGTQTHPSRAQGGVGEGHRGGGGLKKTFLGAPGGWLKCSPSARVARLSREETQEQPAPAPPS